ncbi:hypothetical protein LguiB_006355 [Lonicera macranthoides]
MPWRSNGRWVQGNKVAPSLIAIAFGAMRPTVKITKDQGAVHRPGFVVIAKMIGQWCWNVVHSDVEWVYFGCGVMENGVSRKIEETDRSLASIIEVDCPCVTPEVVLEASSHVDNFTNIIVKDEKTHTCYSAEHLIKDFCKEKLEKDANISSEKLAELNHMLAALDQMIFLLKN